MPELLMLLLHQLVTAGHFYLLNIASAPCSAHSGVTQLRRVTPESSGYPVA